MWGFQNPVECKAAEQCLAENNPLAAAQALLGSDQPAHREVRRLMLKTAPLLVREARRLFDAGEWDAAAMWIETAARCAALSPDDEALQRAIAARRDERQAEQSWRQQRLRRVDDLGREGRLVSALQHLEPLGDEPEVARRRLDLRDDVERLARYVAEFQTYLGEQNWTAAEVVLAKARQLAPREPQVVAMDEQLKASRPPEAPPIAPPPFVPVAPSDDASDEEGKARDESTSDWAVAREANSASSSSNAEQQPTATGPAVRTTLLSGLSSYDDVLIIPRSTILVGTPKHLSVDLAIHGALSSQHALLICEQSRKGPARWSVQPLQSAGVTVDGRAVEPGHNQRLENEQIVQFGQPTCR
ncbi:MAG TPA: FHA domain-containing protein, partial [Pirellulaceae bacterium]|nr:FHA domain-containing protein [Pirellulaceae bacterium]